MEAEFQSHDAISSAMLSPIQRQSSHQNNKNASLQHTLDMSDLSNPEPAAQSSQTHVGEKRSRPEDIDLPSIPHVSSQSDSWKKEYEALRITYQQLRDRHEMELKKRDQQLNRLRRQLEFATHEQESIRKEYHNAKIQYSAEKFDLQKKAVESESKVKFLEAQMCEWKERAIENENSLSTLQSHTRMELQLLQEELEAVKVSENPNDNQDDAMRVEEFRAQLNEKDIALTRMTQTLNDSQEIVENAKSVEALHNRIHVLESSEQKLKAELVHLNGSLKNHTVLKEKMYQMMQQLKAAEHQRDSLEKELISMQKIKELHTDFIGYFKAHIKDSKNLENLERNPALAVLDHCQSLQKELETVLGQRKDAQSQLQKVEKQYQMAENEIETTRHRCKELEHEINKLETKATAVHSVVANLRKLNEELLQILKSYEINTEKNYHPNIQLDDITASMVPAEESVSKLVVTEGNTTIRATDHAKRDASLLAEVENLKQENKKLAKSLDKAAEDIAYHESRLGRGDYRSDTVKVVHLAVNPTQEILGQKVTGATDDAKADLQSSTSSSNSDALTTTTSYDTLEGQKLLNKRLKEVFQEQTRQYREAVYLLTGYKIELKKANGYELLRLRSTYALQKDDELLVRMEKNGNLELLDTDYCRQIDQRVFAYLTTCRSFPAFLGNLTLHLFEKQTFQGI